jgi:hypothetical protein
MYIVAVRYSDGLRLDGIRFPGKIFFVTPQRPDRLWGSPNLLSNEYWVLIFRGVKRQGREADHSPPTRAEVKKKWIYNPLPHTPS